MEPQLEALRERLRLRGETFQPIPVFVGPLINIDASYVAVNHNNITLYMVDTPLHAVHLCLETFFALNCEHSESARLIWVFLQKACLDIHLDSDPNNRSVDALLGGVQAIMDGTYDD